MTSKEIKYKGYVIRYNGLAYAICKDGKIKEYVGTLNHAKELITNAIKED